MLNVDEVGENTKLKKEKFLSFVIYRRKQKWKRICFRIVYLYLESIV